MTMRAVLSIDPDGTLRPKRAACTYLELSKALREYLYIVAMMRRRAPGPAGFRYHSTEELVLFNCTPVYANLNDMTVPAMAPKECFDNAFKLANDDLRYTEGYALMDGSIPTHHGWLTAADGSIQDPTWPAVYRRHADSEAPGKDWSGRAVYMGVALDRERHRNWVWRTGYPNIMAVYEADVRAVLERGLDAI